MKSRFETGVAARTILLIGILISSIPATSQAMIGRLTKILAELSQGFKASCAAFFVGQAVNVFLKKLTGEHYLKNLRAIVPERRKFFEGPNVSLLDE